MPITLGILAQSRQAVATGAFDLLESTVLTGSQASVSFTNLTTKYAASYQHLQLRMTLRQDTNSNGMQIRFNGDSGSNYFYHYLEGNGSSVASAGGSYTSVFDFGAAALLEPANLFSANVVDILDPFETTKNKTVRMLNGHSGTYRRIALASGAWFNTASVTSIAVLPNTSNWVSGCRFSLYGIRGS
jgi:hypothetical protein